MEYLAVSPTLAECQLEQTNDFGLETNHRIVYILCRKEIHRRKDATCADGDL